MECSGEEGKFLLSREDSTYASTLICGSLFFAGITTVALLKKMGGSRIIAHHTPVAYGRHGSLLLAV